MMLSESLKLVMNQTLLPHVSGKGRVASFEILMVTSAVSSLIRDNKLTLLPSLMTIGKNVGMRTVDDALAELVQDGLISAETAYMKAQNKDEFESMVTRSFLEGRHAA